MSRVSATIRVRPDSPSVGAAGSRTVTIDRGAAAGGLGLGFNGGELLLLALGACYANDLHREARKMGLEILRADVEVSAEFPAEGAPGESFRYDVRLEAKGGDEKAIRALVEHTDRVAEIHNTVRVGRPVALGRVEIAARSA